MLLYPVWLALLIPLVVVSRMWMLPTRSQRTLRYVTYVLIVLAMCGPVIEMESRGGTLVVVADRSCSMPFYDSRDEAERNRQQGIVGDLLKSKDRGENRLAVVSFGSNTALELSPHHEEFGGFIHKIDGDGSDLTAAIEKGVSFIPKDGGRLLLLTDGRWTGRDPKQLASYLAGHGIAVDYQLWERKSSGDTAIARISVPSRVIEGESFLLSAWVHSPVSQEIRFKLSRGEHVIGSGARTVSSGLTRLTFRDRALKSGTNTYVLEVAGNGDDPVPENNKARMLVDILGGKPILCVSAKPGSGLARKLIESNLRVRSITPPECSFSLEELSGFAAVILENIPAQDLGEEAMENLALWVKESGRGLMVTGGQNTYAPGGYFRSALDPILPLSMELRKEHRKLGLAIVVALDRSGSMGAPAGGRTKMDLANLAAVQVLDLLTAMDEFGVLAVDTEAHIIVPLSPAEKARRARGEILRIAAGGGGIYVFEALAGASRLLLSAEASTRHVILFADVDDAEEPGKYQELLLACRNDNITVSVVGLGVPTDHNDATLLRDIAHKGKGRCFFTDKPEELPRLFAQDTFVLARSAFVEESTAVSTTPELLSLTGKKFSPPAAIGGYNLCYLRPSARVAMITRDKYQAPVVAAWQVGLGRVLCYTGEADGKYTGAIAAWGEVGEFFASLARWTAGEENKLPGDMAVTQATRKGICTVHLHLDPARQQHFEALPELSILRGSAGEKTRVEKMKMRYLSPGTLSAEIPLHGKETILPTLAVSDVAVGLAPVCLPYSPEYEPVDTEPAQSLKVLARATGGKSRTAAADVWQDMPIRPRMWEMGYLLLLAAVVTILLEILERRTGYLSLLDFLPYLARKMPVLPGGSRADASRRRTSPEIKDRELPHSGRQDGPEPPDAPTQKPPEQPQGEGMMSALRLASHSAKQRTDRGENPR